MRIGVIGASGYVGGEMLRLLVSHPKVEIAMVTSRQHVGEYVSRIHPSLKGFIDITFSELDYDKLDRKSTRLNSSHIQKSRMPSSA